MGSFGTVVVVIGLTLVLAGLDVVESVLAKEWLLRRSPWFLLAGLVTSMVLFALFAVAIGYTQMSTVTIGWVIVMQLALMVTETVRYGVSHSTDRWVVMGLIVCLLSYLIITPSSA